MGSHLAVPFRRTFERTVPTIERRSEVSIARSRKTDAPTRSGRILRVVDECNGTL